MARTGKVSASTVAKFIAPDDSAIGGDPKTFQERYSKYIRTSDHRVLELKAEEKPAFYYVRPYLLQEKSMIRDYFASLEVKDESAETEGKSMTAEALEEAVHNGDPNAERFDILRREVVYECIVGCVDHPMTEDAIPDDGNLITTHVQWKVGTPEPVGLRESMIKDPMLSTVLFQYLFTVSNLSETEKN